MGKDDSLKAAFAEGLIREVNNACELIVHCLEQLDEDEVWKRPTPELNSVGNLILHVCGNLKQWFLTAAGKNPEPRNRPKEFSEQGPIPKSELIQQLQSTREMCLRAVEQTERNTLTAIWTIQGYSVTGADAMIHSAAHLRGHTQEIVHMTRTKLGSSYRTKLVIE